DSVSDDVRAVPTATRGWLVDHLVGGRNGAATRYPIREMPPIGGARAVLLSPRPARRRMQSEYRQTPFLPKRLRNGSVNAGASNVGVLGGSAQAPGLGYTVGGVLVHDCYLLDLAAGRFRYREGVIDLRPPDYRGFGSDLEDALQAAAGDLVSE